MSATSDAASGLARFRWGWAGVAGCAYFWGHLLSALVTGDTDDHPGANALTDVALTLVTILAVWRLQRGSTPYMRYAIATAGLAGFIVLSLGPGRIDSATAFVPATWLGAAVIARLSLSRE